MVSTDAGPCGSCPEKHTCEQVYKQLGRSKAGPVMARITAAFVVPLAVFIGVLALTYDLAQPLMPGEAATGFTSLAVAAAAGFVAMLSARKLNHILSKNEERSHYQGRI